MNFEDATINAINTLVDGALESAEAALLNLNTDADTVQCSGRFLTRSSKRQLGLERSIYDSAEPVTFTENNNSDFSASISSLHSSSKKLNTNRSCHPSSPPSSVFPVDVFRFPLRGEDVHLNAHDGVYTSVDDKSLLIVRNLQDGTSVDAEEVKRLQNYYSQLKSAKQCAKCCKNAISNNPAPSYVSPSSSSFSSVQSSVDSFSAKTQKQPVSSTLSSVTNSTFSVTSPVAPVSASTEYTTSRLTSSVITQPSQTAPTCSPFGVLNSDASGLSVDFTTVIKDPKSGQKHSLHFIVKCSQEQPTRVYINGRAFGPCSD